MNKKSTLSIQGKALKAAARFLPRGLTGAERTRAIKYFVAGWERGYWNRRTDEARQQAMERAGNVRATGQEEV